MIDDEGQIPAPPALAELRDEDQGSIRRVGVHPDVLAETARGVQQRLAEIVTGLRDDGSCRS